MKKQFKSGLIVGLLLLKAIAIQTPLSGAQSQNDVRLVVSLEASQLGLHEPIYAVFSIENHLSETLEVDLGLDNLRMRRRATFAFSITDPDGRVLQIPPFPTYPDGNFGNPAVVSIKPGSTYKLRLLLNEWYEFRSIGDYRVGVKTDAVFRTESGRTVLPSTASIIVARMGPKNENRLTRICNDLAKLVETSDLEGQVEAIQAMSYVRDPVAVPYMKLLLENNRLISLFLDPIVAALGRIGSTDAIDALIANLPTKDADLRSMIVSELKKLESSTTDAKLKTQIQNALR